MDILRGLLLCGLYSSSSDLNPASPQALPGRVASQYSIWSVALESEKDHSPLCVKQMGENTEGKVTRRD